MARRRVRVIDGASVPTMQALETPLATVSVSVEAKLRSVVPSRRAMWTGFVTILR